MSKKRNLKRLLSAALTGCLLFTSVPVPAAQPDEDAGLKDRLRSAVSDEQYPDGLTGFEKTRLSVDEGESTTIRILRQGNTDKEATVSFKAIDISAEYGSDYLLTAKHSALKKEQLEKNEEAEPLMNQYAVVSDSVGDEILVASEETDDIEGAKEKLLGDVSGNDAGEASEKESSEEPKSGLAAAYEAQMHEEAPENDWKETNPEAAPEQLEEASQEGNEQTLEYWKKAPGEVTTLTFAPGEYVKEIVFDALDDERSESQEQMVFVLVDAQGTEIDANYNGYVNILDNDAKEDSVFAVAQKEIRIAPDQDTAEVTIKRTAGIDRMAFVTVGTKAVDAEPNTDYEAGTQELIFAPGQTEKTVDVAITSDRSKSSSFFVGISKDGAVVDEENNATLVIIEEATVPVDPADLVVEKDPATGTVALKDVSSADAQKASEQEEVSSESLSASESSISAKDTDKSYSASGSGWIYSGIDLRLATGVTVNYNFDGETVEDHGCDGKVYYKDKTVTLFIANGTSLSKVVATGTADQHSKNGSGSVTISRDLLKELSKWGNLSSAGIYLTIGGKNGNKNASVSATSITVKYADFSFNINNDNKYNFYYEQQYSGNSTKTQIGEIKLGSACFDNNTDSTSKSVNGNQSLNISWRYSGVKNSQGVPVNSYTVEFKGYALKKPGTGNEYSAPVKGIDGKIDYDFIKNNKDYLMSPGYTFQVAPVFEVKKANVKFKNDYPDKVSYKGFSAEKTLEIKKLDTLSISGSAGASYSVSNIQVQSNDAKFTTSSQQSAQADKSKLTCGLGNTDAADYTVSLQYEDAKVKVMPDPKMKGTNAAKQGAVVYIDEQNNVYTASLDPTQKTKDRFEIKNVIMNQTYSIVGIPKNGYSPVWRDGTLDTNESGDEIPLTQDGYKSFTPVRGNVLPYTTKLSIGRVYYSFEKQQEVGDPADIYGYLKLRDRMILTGVEYDKGINGANLTANGKQTQSAYGGLSVKNYDDGFFRIEDKTFRVLDYYLVNANAYGDEGSINTSFVMVPGYIYDCIIDTADDLDITDAKVFTSDDGTNYEQQTITKNKRTGYYTGVTNGPQHVRIEMRADKNSVYIDKGVLEFYDKEGKKLPAKVDGVPFGDEKSGYMRFDFVPEALGLKSGTTLRVVFTDNQGHTYLQRELGMMLSQSYSTLAVANTFAFGGNETVLDVVGSISSALGMNWTGNFDKPGDHVSIDEETGDKTITIGYKKEILNKKTTKDETTNSAKELAAKQKAVSDIEAKIVKLKKNKNRTAAEDAELIKLEEEDLPGANSDKLAQQVKHDEVVEASKDPEKTHQKLAAGVNLEVEFGFNMTFGCDDEGDYYFKSMILSAKVSGKAEVSVEFATPIGVTITLTFTAGGEGSASFVVEERTDRVHPTKYYIKNLLGGDGKEDATIYRIFDCNMNDDSRRFDCYGSFNLKPSLGIKAKVGIAGGTVEAWASGQATFNLQFFTNEKENTGTVNLTASIGVKVLFIEHEWELASVDLSLFGNSDTSSLLGTEGENWLYESADILKPMDISYMEGGTRWKNGAISAKSLDEDEKGFADAPIGDKITESPGFKMVSLGEGRYAAVFLNAVEGREAVNAAGVYYMTGATNGGVTTWNTDSITLVDNDGTLDQDVKITSLGAKGAIITWSSADKVFTEETDRVEMQNSLNLKCAFVSPSGDLGAVQEITKTTKDAVYTYQDSGTTKTIDYNDHSADICANVSINEDENELVVYYQKKEYKADGDELLGDVLFPETTVMAYMTARYNSGNWIWKSEADPGFIYSPGEAEEIMSGWNGTDEEKKTRFQVYEKGWYGQLFFDFLPRILVDEELDEDGYWTEVPEVSVLDADSSRKALIIDSSAMSYNDLGVFAYTIDLDGDQSSTGDREVYMQIFNFADHSFKHPILITSDGLEDKSVQFARLLGKTYLVWLHGGDIVALNMSNIVKNYNETVNGGQKLLIKPDGVNAYYINKTKPSVSNGVGYMPFSSYVKGEKGDADENVSMITDFRVQASDAYAYLLWTQIGMQVDPNLDPEDPNDALAMQDPKNARTDTQIYTARVDLRNGDITKPVQVTSKYAENFSDLAFAVEGDDLVGLAYKVNTRLITMDEYNASVAANNAEAQRQAQLNHQNGINEDGIKDNKEIPLATKDTFTPYCISDVENAKPVAFRIDPKGAAKIKNASFRSDLMAGSEVRAGFEILNDGVANTQAMTLTAVDGDGNSVLLAPDYTANGVQAGEEAVESITVNPMLGGYSDEYFCNMALDEDATEASITITLKEGDTVVATQTLTRTLRPKVGVESLSVEQTDVRNQYKVTGKIVNDGNAKAQAGKIELGTVNGGKLADVDYGVLKPEESVEFEKIVTVDPVKAFAKETDPDGAAKETATFYGKGADGKDEAEIVRSANESQMKAIRGLKGLKTLEIEEGSEILMDQMIDSSLAAKDGSSTGAENLVLKFESSDAKVLSIDENNVAKANALGTAKVKLTAYPKNSSFVAQNLSGKNMQNAVLGYYEDALLTLPQAAIYEKEFTITVKAKTVKPDGLQVGETFTINKATYKVTAPGEVTFAKYANKKVKKFSVPTTVTGSDKKNYKVTAIAPNAFKNCKKLTKVTIGKNVKTIGKNAFKGCKSLKKIFEKSKVLKKVGKFAFKGIHPKARFKLYGNKKQKKKIAKLIKKSKGIKKTMVIK